MARVLEDLKRLYDEIEARAYAVATADPGRERFRRKQRIVKQASPWMLLLIELNRDLRLVIDAYRRRDGGLDEEALAELEQWRKTLPEKMRQFRNQ
jgi:hypothetical protein